MGANGKIQAKQARLRTLAIDIGGTSIKAVLLNDSGKPLTEPTRAPTPHPAKPKAVLSLISAVAKQHGGFHRVSVGFPGVVRKGIIHSAPNLHPSWKGIALARVLSKTFRVPAKVANDADVQGFGAIEGRGVELFLTMGTGVGSALFVDGRLAPNLETAHHPFRKGKTYEQCLGLVALNKIGPKKWNHRLRLAIQELEKLFNYDCLFIGGGNARLIAGDLPTNVKLVPNVASQITDSELRPSCQRSVQKDRTRGCSRRQEKHTFLLRHLLSMVSPVPALPDNLRHDVCYKGTRKKR